MTSTMTRPTIILGTGYSGRHLAEALTATSRPFFATSREPEKNLSHVQAGRRMKFDLEQPSTWLNLPARADLIWCFPATPLEQVQAFARALDAPARRMVVLGSTSAYEASDHSAVYPPSWIDESTPLDLSKSRVQGEEYLREHHGAILLRVAGIYGPGRNPLDWIRQGRIGPSRKYVNLIHVEDLAAVCLVAIEKGKPGEAYNISDGTPRTWEEICATAQQRWGVAPASAKENRASGKRITTAKLRTALGYTLKHSDLYEALASIESADRVAVQDGQNGFQQGPRREGTGGVPSGVR
jgi:nucleoside-diphosphate-sugar epimerase